MKGRAHNFQDITGQKFNMLTAVEYRGQGRWLFRCDCGNKKVIKTSHVKDGKTRSCGCFNHIIQEVYQYSLNGELIAIHKNMTDASKSINKGSSAIIVCCKGGMRTAYGFIWLYKSDLHLLQERIALINNGCVENLHGEEWRDIKDYPNRYQISNLGRVKAVARIEQKADGRTVTYREHLLATSISPYGYVVVTLNMNRIPRPCFVHRLIAEAFIPNPNNYPHIDHINTIRDDNRIENLRWCTPKMNNANELTVKHRAQEIARRIQSGWKFGEAKMRAVEMLDRAGRVVGWFASMTEAARELGIKGTSGISEVCRGHSKTCRGFGWRYAKQN